jgi:hypothetical protein
LRASNADFGISPSYTFAAVRYSLHRSRRRAVAQLFNGAGSMQASVKSPGESYKSGRLRGTMAEHHDLHAGGRNYDRRLKITPLDGVVVQHLPGTRDPLSFSYR